jgi:hypothetical protein
MIVLRRNGGGCAGVAGFVFVVERGDDYHSFMYHHDSSTSSTSTLRTPTYSKMQPTTTMLLW